MDYNYQIRLRRGTSTQWELSDPVLLDGEPGYDTTLNYYKIGDGVRRWSELPWTTGLKGDPATVDAGSTTTIDPDSPAKVTNAGTTQNAIFDFEIPEGKPGKDLFIHEGSAQNPPVDWLPRELLWDPDAEPTVGDIPLGNLLTPNQASGGDALGTTEGFTTTGGVTVEVTTAGALNGSRSLKVVNGPSGVRTVRLLGPGNALRHPATPGVPITFSCDLKSISPPAGHVVAAYFIYYDAAGAYVSEHSDNAVYLGADTVRLTGTVVPPPRTATTVVALRLDVGSLTAGHELLADNFGFWEGAGGDWAMPGTPILNQGRRVSRPNATDRLVEVWDGAAWIPVHYDSGWRDITGLLNAGWTATHVKVRRVNETVHVQVANMHAPGDQYYWVTPPAGFATARSYYVMFTSPDLVIAQEAAQVSTVVPGGAKVPASTAIWVEFAWTTNDPIPTSLPGTLVTTAP